MFSNKEIGNIGENIATELLKSKGYTILHRNYNKKWGEIDIITKRNNIVHFIEVKAISHKTSKRVSRENTDEYRPEENMHERKIERIHRAIQSYISEYKITEEWQLDLVAVQIFLESKEASCRIIYNVL